MKNTEIFEGSKRIKKAKPTHASGWLQSCTSPEATLVVSTSVVCPLLPPSGFNLLKGNPRVGGVWIREYVCSRMKEKGFSKCRSECLLHIQDVCLPAREPNRAYSLHLHMFPYYYNTPRKSDSLVSLHWERDKFMQRWWSRRVILPSDLNICSSPLRYASTRDFILSYSTLCFELEEEGIHISVGVGSWNRLVG